MVHEYYFCLLAAEYNTAVGCDTIDDGGPMDGLAGAIDAQVGIDITGLVAVGAILKYTELSRQSVAVVTLDGGQHPAKLTTLSGSEIDDDRAIAACSAQGLVVFIRNDGHS